MENKYNENDLREAFKAGLLKGTYPSYIQGELDEDEWINDYCKKIEEVVEEETVPITLAQIKRTCGWSEFCDVTGSNHYMLKEWTVDDRTIFDVKISQAKELGLIR